MALVRTDVSAERIASIIRVTRISELGTTLAVTGNRSTLRRKVHTRATRHNIHEHGIFAVMNVNISWDIGRILPSHLQQAGFLLG
jgi:hypothetical protein